MFLQSYLSGLAVVVGLEASLAPVGGALRSLALVAAACCDAKNWQCASTLLFIITSKDVACEAVRFGGLSKVAMHRVLWSCVVGPHLARFDQAVV
jgi:hypothetical protein